MPTTIRDWNDTRTPYPRDACLDELFDARARTRPEALAAVHGDRRLTYGELRARSDALAHRLVAGGVRHGDRIGVCGSRSIEALVALLGIVKAGAAYVPLDGTTPPLRLQAMAEQAGVHAAVVLPGHTCRLRRLRTRFDLDETGHADGRPAVGGRRATDRAYVMFTSGTTGRPKAVAVPHRGVVRLAVSDPRLTPPGPRDRVLHAYDLSSDASTIEIWSALLGGAALVLVEREELLSEEALARLLERHEVTMAYLTTSVFHHMARNRPAALRRLRFVSAGGEAMAPDLARAVLAACPDTTVVNFYGPTENTVVSTAHVIERLPEDAASVPIGRPIANSTCHVLLPDGGPADVGQEGELLVGGDGLALGYLGDPELTAAKFVPDPHLPGGRLYRTGDRAVRRPDGELEFRGRLDGQIKLRGHRIELEEVEARLRAHPEVGQAAVVLSDGGARSGALVACVTPLDGRPVPVERVRQYLTQWLPAPAVPARFVEMERLPVNRAGKVDRARLAELVAARPQTAPPAETTARDDGLADALASVWETVLRVRPRPDDDFFAIGGDSLLAAEVVTRTLTAAGIDAGHGSRLIGDLLHDPTLAAYAATVERIRSRDAAAAHAAVDWEAEARLGFRLPEPGPTRARPEQAREILLTGASGFLGAYLLERLLRLTGARVHCPVRARDEAHALHRVRANLDRYGLDPEIVDDRVVCFPGELTAPRLGLDEERHRELSGSLDLVLHSAAHVNFLYPYSALRDANVGSVRELVRLAAPRRAPLHLLSTIAVVAGFGTAGVRHVAEDLPLDHADRLTMGYAESKWVAERVLTEAGAQGLPVAVHRPYEITGDQWHGACNTETAICSLFRTIADTGLAPDIALPMDFVPVDWVAAAIVHIATTRPADGSVYHLTNPSPARLDDMLERMRAAGYAVRTLPYDRWVEELVAHVAANPTSPTAPFVSLCVDRCNRADMSVKEMYFEETFPRLGRDNVLRDLADSGLRCPPVDAALLDHYLRYFMNVGYLPRPQNPSHGDGLVALGADPA
ncbi:amino acid adenylation domain-containing protein [Spirillospora sp. NPDC050679]